MQVVFSPCGLAESEMIPAFVWDLFCIISLVLVVYCLLGFGGVGFGLVFFSLIPLWLGYFNVFGDHYLGEII